MNPNVKEGTSMELPEALARGLDALLAQHENISGGRAQVRTAGAAISLRYRTNPGTGERLILTDTEALAYAVSRMPATFAAVYDALQKADPAAALTVRSLLDVGTGTGAASWAAAQYYGLQSAVCLDVEPVMLRTAGALFQYGPQPLRGARLMQCDAAAGPLPAQADLVVSAYMLGELAPARRTAALRAMWDAAGSMLLLVLPGTPQGYAAVRQARALLLEWGGIIAAPCTHMGDCPLQKDDWCHFSCRVPRTRLHRQIKGGSAPYEDEKYAYLAAVRAKAAEGGGFRVLRHPHTHKGYVRLTGCTPRGIETRTVTRSQSDDYRAARRAAWGDLLPWR